MPHALPKLDWARADKGRSGGGQRVGCQLLREVVTGNTYHNMDGRDMGHGTWDMGGAGRQVVDTSKNPGTCV
jgi:hypothetical protein